MVSTMRLMSQDAFDEPTARILRGWLRTGSCSHQAAAARPEHQRRGAPEQIFSWPGHFGFNHRMVHPSCGYTHVFTESRVIFTKRIPNRSTRSDFKVGSSAMVITVLIKELFYLLLEVWFYWPVRVARSNVSSKWTSTMQCTGEIVSTAACQPVAEWGWVWGADRTDYLLPES